MLTFIIILTFVASFFGTIAGFGSSVIMLPVLLFFFPLPEVLLFAGIVHILNDIWEMVLFRGSVSWRILIIFGATGARGRLPVNVNPDFIQGDGISTSGNIRLKYSFPAYVGVNVENLQKKIDSIAQDAHNAVAMDVKSGDHGKNNTVKAETQG